MQSTITNVDDYIESLPAERKSAISELRKTIKKNLPKGFEEGMTYGMIGYFVPHSIYPAGYHCNPKLPLPFINIGSQKNYIAVHHLGIYGDEALLNWFLKEFPKHSDDKLDMGKGCIRFKKPEKIPFKLLGELAKKINVNEWINLMKKYEKK
jgi:hypothetical protein